MSEQVKQSIVAWKNLCLYDQRYYFPKAMDLFSSWPHSFKTEFLHFVTDRHHSPIWAKMLDDDSLYPDVLRCILNCYTSGDVKSEFAKKKLARVLMDFMKSEAFDRASKNIEENTDQFMEALDLL